VEAVADEPIVPAAVAGEDGAPGTDGASGHLADADGAAVAVAPPPAPPAAQPEAPELPFGREPSVPATVQEEESAPTPIAAEPIQTPAPEPAQGRQRQPQPQRDRDRNGGQRGNRPKDKFREEAEPPPLDKEAAANAINIAKLQAMSMADLNQMAREMGIENFGTMKKHEVIFQILQKNAERSGILFSEGVLEILPEGFGFLRSQSFNYLPCPEDIYVSPSQIRRFDLQTGDLVAGQIRPPKEKERFFCAPQGRSGRKGRPRQSQGQNALR